MSGDAESAADVLASLWGEDGDIVRPDDEAQPSYREPEPASVERTPRQERARVELGDKVMASYRSHLRRAVEDGEMNASDVERKAARMLEWMEYCQRERSTAKRRSFFELGFGELFDRSLAPKLEPLSSRPTCGSCGDNGILYTEDAQPRRHNVHRRNAPGIRTCLCPRGQSRNAALAELGAPKKRTRAEEYE